MNRESSLVLGMPPEPDGTEPFELVTALIPLIRRDERNRCLAALRALPVPGDGLFSPGYRAGHDAALAEAERAVERLPVSTEVPALDDEFGSPPS